MARYLGADDQAFISVPLAALLFGRREFFVSPIQSAVEADLQRCETSARFGRQNCARVLPRALGLLLAA